MDVLTDLERALLDLARDTRTGGLREQAVRDRLDMSATRFHQLLDQLIDRPAALEHDPVLVNRLRRLRADRSRARARLRSVA